MKTLIVLIIGGMIWFFLGLNVGNKVSEQASMAILDQTFESSFSTIQNSLSGSDANGILQGYSDKLQAQLEAKKQELKDDAELKLKQSIVSKITELFDK